MRKVNRKQVYSFVSLLMILCLSASMVVQVTAATPPTTISAPENFAATNYGGGSLVCTLSAPDD